MRGDPKMAAKVDKLKERLKYGNRVAEVHEPGTWESPTPGWSARREAKLGYAELEFASPTEMTLTYRLSESGAVADAFTLTRPVPP